MSRTERGRLWSAGDGLRVERIRPALRRLDGRLSARVGVGLAITSTLAFLPVCVLVGGTVLLHPGDAVVGMNPSSDYQVMTWSLRWWPWAVSHGVDPLTTPLFWPPLGFSALWMTTIPAVALLALPITLTAGPLAAYNVMMLLAVPAAAGAAYLLCRELTDRFWPSLVGGLLFGLSPYMLGHTLSQHLDLTFVFPIPLLAWLVVRHARGRTSAPRFVAGFAALLLAQLGASFELFLDVALIAAIGSVLALVGGGRARSSVPIVRLIWLAYAFCLPVLVPVAVLAFSATHAPLRYAPVNFSTDLLNVVVPTPTLLAGQSHWLRRVTQHFVANIGEQDGYLGLPLLVVAVLAVKAEWRRWAWLIGALLVTALLLSFGPVLTYGGRPIVGLPFALAHLPLLGTVLPIRLSLFVALAAACLCALWLARPGRVPLRVAVGAIVVLSLLPNFRPARYLPGAWAISNTFGWSLAHVSNGFVADPAWRRVVRPGATVLVLPTGDRTAASYWEAETAMRFKLAVPTTPFAPPQVAAAPVVSGLVTNDLPALTTPTLGAARLRSFLLSDHVADVVVTQATGWRSRQMVATATGSRPVRLASTQIYPVPSRLRPLRARGKTILVHAPGEQTELVARRDLEALAVWLTFDGRRAHLYARLRPSSGGADRTATLSLPSSDPSLISAAVDDRGRAAVAFVDWTGHHDLLRVATDRARRWQIATLDRSRQPIWAPRVALLSSGTVAASWVAEDDPWRTLRVAVLSPSGEWPRSSTLETAATIGSTSLVAARTKAVSSWSDAIAGEKRVRAAVFDRGRWGAPVTVAASLEPLTHIRLEGTDGTLLRWEAVHALLYESHRAGTAWTDIEQVRKEPLLESARPGSRSPA